MKIGDKVRLIDEEGVYIIKNITGTKVLLLDSYGFEIIYSIDKIISAEKYENIYNAISNVSTKKEDVSSKKKNIFAKKNEKERIIDLHIGNLVDSVKNLTPHQMLEKQINRANEEIKLAKMDKINKLIFIHGKGKGVLKKEIYKILNTIDDIEFFEADIIKYRFGAVEVRFK
ncbi:MAG: Smr/MutS family protein [Apibacter sp.]|uniref:Smr/MutS family protein n=1 Tax=Apibacter sp. TaxID=2023709 RepID=UPI0025F1221C|nr:Smr/MutS family protein [Apibacter sp.]MCT6869787.1 Smr/MutS family protein [Apibacter sp.]